MKPTLLILLVSASIMVACNQQNKQEKAPKTEMVNDTIKVESNSNEPIIKAYLKIKDALIKDNGDDAAKAGTELVAEFKTFDQKNLADDQKKPFNNISEDAIEMAEHIGANSNKIEHQREHFSMLTDDMYELVKILGTTSTLYKIHCPMYNNNKGANWLSASNKIENPYLGQQMLTCGNVEEEIK
jgi:hypothetical protein